MEAAEENVSFRQIEIFCKIAELGSFSRAASAVFLSQPTVSQHIAVLESLVGVKLLDRTGKRVVLTKAGQVYYEHSSKILQLRRKALEQLGSFMGVTFGELVLGASTIPATYILPRVIGRFAKKYPNVKVVLHSGDTAEICDRVEENICEIGFVGSRIRHTALAFKKFASDTLVLAVPAGHKWAGEREISIKELTEEPFVLREGGSGTRASFERELSKQGARIEDLKVVCQLGSSETVKEAVCAGLGVSIISNLAIEREVAAGEIFALSVRGVNFARDFYSVVLAQQTLSPAAQAFVQFLT